MKYALTSIFILFLNLAFSQTRIGAEVLGSNGFGLSVNVEQIFPLTGNNKIGIGAGLGTMVQGEIGWLYKGGTYYYFGSWGVGADFSVLNRIGEPAKNSYSEVDLLVYPNVNYSWFLQNYQFFKLSMSMGITRHQVINPDMNPDLNHDPYWVYYPFWVGLVYGKGLKKK